jgi:hypothetical protein
MKSWLKDNGLVIGLLVFIGLLIYALAFTRGELKVKSDQIDNYSSWVENGRIRGAR